MSSDTTTPAQAAAPRWQPIGSTERRVLGVLIEKAKTTPENYPLSLNAIRTGANQKTNRYPLTNLEEDQIAESLEALRKLGAVAEIQGGARVDKYRHLAYEWLGVDKVELAVMAELLLRGSQTIGELRGRAARMEPIKDLGELQPILDSLLDKKLIQRLTPAGRGAVVTHNLYLERELEKVRREAAGMSTDDELNEAAPTIAPPVRVAHEPPTAMRLANAPSASNRTSDDSSDVLATDVRRLREELADVRRDFNAARAEFELMAEQLRKDLDELNRQLGN